MHRAVTESAAHLGDLFQSNRDTVIVPADRGLGILENLSKRPVMIEQYAAGTYLPEMAAPAGVDQGNFNDLAHQRYTSVLDLDIATRLARLPSTFPLERRSTTRVAQCAKR